MPHDVLDLSSQQGIKLLPPAAEVQGPNYWTSREFPEKEVIYNPRY